MHYSIQYFMHKSPRTESVPGKSHALWHLCIVTICIVSISTVQGFCVIIGLQKSVKCHEDCHQEDAYCCPVVQIAAHLVNILQWFYIIIGLHSHKSVKCHEDCHGEDAYCCPAAQIVAHLVNILQWLYIIIGLHKSVKHHECEPLQLKKIQDDLLQ